MRPVLLTFILIWSFAPSVAQPCGPSQRLVDRIFVTPDSKLVLVSTLYTGNMESIHTDQKFLDVNVAMISSQGSVIVDTLLRIPWDGLSYDQNTCRALYKGDVLSYPSDIRGTCSLYLPMVLDDKIIMPYFLGGDKRHAYIIQIDEKGIVSFEQMDLYDYIAGFYDDFSKYSTIAAIMSERFPSASTMSRTVLNWSSDSISASIEETKLKIEYGSQPDVAFSRTVIGSPQWIVKKGLRKTRLNGYLTYERRPEVVAMNDEHVFILVYNNDQSSCMFLPDTLPIVYCLKRKNGKKVWELKMDDLEDLWIKIM